MRHPTCFRVAAASPFWLLLFPASAHAQPVSLELSNLCLSPLPAGVGFGSVMAKAAKVTDEMFVAASQVGTLLVCTGLRIVDQRPQALDVQSSLSCSPLLWLACQPVALPDAHQPNSRCCAFGMQALADAVSEEQLARKEMYPEITQLRAVSCKVGG